MSPDTRSPNNLIGSWCQCSRIRSEATAANRSALAQWSGSVLST